MTIAHLSTLSDSDFLSLLRAYESGWEADVLRYAALRLFRIQGFIIVKP